MTTLRGEGIRKMLGGVIFALGFPLYVGAVIAADTRGAMATMLSVSFLAGAGICVAAALAVLQYRAKTVRRVTVDDRGLVVDGALRVGFASVRGVLLSNSFGTPHLRITTTSETVLLTFDPLEMASATDLARALDARTRSRVWEIESTRRNGLGLLVAMLAAVLMVLATPVAASLDAPPAIVLPILSATLLLGTAAAAFGAFLFSSGPTERLRVGEDGAAVERSGKVQARLLRQEGLSVVAEGDQARFTSTEGSFSFRLPWNGAHALVTALADPSFRAGQADAAIEVPALARGGARSWLSYVKGGAQKNTYRAHQEAAEDLHAIVTDGARPAVERIYAALRLTSRGEGGAVVAAARDTTVSARLRVSLDATLAGNDDALAAELEALAAEEAENASTAATKTHA